MLVGVVRRRRDAGWSRERVAAIVVLVSTSACGDDDATANDATGSSSSTSGATNDTATPVPGWPDNWLGEYHVEKDVRLGFSYDGPILFLPENVTLERDRAWVQVYDCTGTDTAERSYRVAFEPNSVRLLPENDGEELYWVDGTTRLEQLALRPGETCDQLEFLHDYGDSTDGDSDGESVAVLPLVRGRLCVIDPCDLADPNEDPTFILDYCPNTVRECAMPAMDSN